MTPLLSVIIPAFNADKYLGEAIQSVLDQSYSAIEIIVVDDGSTDNTFAIASRFEDKIILLQQENQGAAIARNCGIQHSSGEFLSFFRCG